MTKIIRSLGLTACAGVLMTGVALAQPPPDAPARGRAANQTGLSPVEVLNMLDAYALVQAEKALELKESQYPEFVSRLKRLQETRRRNQQARNRLVQELRRMAQPDAKAGDEIVRERLRALKDHDVRAAAELAGAYDALDEVLEVRQQARFRAFEENLERRKIDLLLRARRGAPVR